MPVVTYFFMELELSKPMRKWEKRKTNKTGRFSLVMIPVKISTSSLYSLEPSSLVLAWSNTFFLKPGASRRNFLFLLFLSWERLSFPLRFASVLAWLRSQKERKGALLFQGEKNGKLWFALLPGLFTRWGRGGGKGITCASKRQRPKEISLYTVHQYFPLFFSGQ